MPETRAIDWQYYPAYEHPSATMSKIVGIFEQASESIRSDRQKLGSNAVLKEIRTPLQALGFRVESDDSKSDKLYVPVLFGRNGKIEKRFDADAYHKDEKIVVEVEAGRGVTNYQFLKDIFQACVMADVDYLVIAVRKTYRGKKDFDTVTSKFLDALYANPRLKLPLKGLLVVGY